MKIFHSLSNSKSAAAAYSALTNGRDPFQSQMEVLSRLVFQPLVNGGTLKVRKQRQQHTQPIVLRGRNLSAADNSDNSNKNSN